MNLSSYREREVCSSVKLNAKIGSPKKSRSNGEQLDSLIENQ
jgi:hypothetical protein